MSEDKSTNPYIYLESVSQGELHEHSYMATPWSESKNSQSCILVRKIHCDKPTNQYLLIMCITRVTSYAYPNGRTPFLMHKKAKNGSFLRKKKRKELPASNFGMQTLLDSANNMGWVPTVSLVECHKHIYVIKLPSVFKKA